MPQISQLIAHPTVSHGGMERIAYMISLALNEKNYCLSEYNKIHAKSLKLLNRWPMINEAIDVHYTARCYKNQLKSYDIVIGHGLYGAFINHPKRVYVHHNTFAGEAQSLRGLIDSQSYFVCRYLYGWIDKQAGKNAIRIAVSKSVADETQKYYHQKPHRIISNSIDTEHFQQYDYYKSREHFNIPKNLWVGLFVGRADIRKGVHTLNSIIPQLPIKSTIILASPTISKILNTENDKIFMAKPISYDELPLLYSACDVLIFPSLYESFGLVIAEALACGLPVITSKVGVVPEIMGEEPAFDQMVVDSGRDADGFINRIKLLQENPEIGRRQAEWGRQLVEERFSLPRFKRDYVELVEQILSGELKP